MNTKTKWHVLIGGFIAYLFDAMEIILLSIALPVIRQDLGLSINEAGALATATLLGIGASSIITGWYSDNYGRRSALIASLVIFGSLTTAIAYASDLYILLLLRFVSGLGLGGVWSVVSAYIAETWPQHQRARATAFVISAFPIGAIIAALAARYMLPEWRTLFFYSGIAVLLPIAYIFFFVQESASWKSEKETATNKQRVAVKEIFSADLRRTTILGTTTASLALLGYWGASTWLPSYLVQERGLSLSAMAGFMAVLNLGNFLGMNFFGFLADKIGKRNTIITTLMLTAVMVPIYVYSSDTNSLFWLGPVYAFFIAFAGLFGSYFSELYPTRVRTLGTGFCFNAGRGLAAFAPILLSGIASYYSLAAGLMVCAGFFVLSALVLTRMPQNHSSSVNSQITDHTVIVK
ncbi:MFS transporter [Pseudomonas fluorescens]|uniref:MFS transporter n=1 Tax=Pseudomonas fluorescens TaxID=294 RepID=UPI003F98C2C7